MLSEIKVENFKCFKDETILPIGKLTLLTGINGKGKSTAIQSLLLPSQSLLEDTESKSLLLNGLWVNLGSFDDVRTTGSSSRSTIHLSYCFEGTDTDQYVCLDTEFGRRYLDEEHGDVEDEGALKLESAKVKSSFFGDKSIDSFNLSKSIDETSYEKIKDLLFDLSRLIFISADRMGPRTFHDSNLNNRTSVGKNGENTALSIYKNREMDVREKLRLDTGDTIKLPEQISAWIAYIFNSGSVNVQSISESLKKIEISPDGSINNYKPENVGYGFSYCLPIVVAGLIAQEGDVLIIENPEAHLHPSAQNRITKFLCKVAESGVTTIIETHSPSILNGVRLSVKDEILKAQNTSVLFFGESDKQLERVMIHEGGIINHWPGGFFDQEEIDLDRLHGL